jgi:phosphate uptake regulator
MFKALLALMKNDSKLDEAFSQSNEMLDINLEMYRMSRRSLRETESEEMDQRVRELDKKINKYERKVRKNVLEHLAIVGIDHLASGLTLVSVIIDMERIGDYAKNIVQLAANYPGRLRGGTAENELVLIEGAIDRSFQVLDGLMKNSDEKAAETFVKEYLWVNPLCDKLLIELISTPASDMPAPNAVTLALYIRYLKRINSHLRNIVTSVYRPFHKIGFVSSRVKAEGQLEPPEE